MQINEHQESNLRILGPLPFSRDENGVLLTRIMTLFPYSRILVTEPPTFHGDQCAAYFDYVNEQRVRDGAGPLGEEDKNYTLENMVPLTVIDGGDKKVYVVIRPNPDNMELAYQADEMLQFFLPKFRIYFMHTEDQNVRREIRKRGEAWRIQPLPRSVSGMQKVINNSRIYLNEKDEAIYYYNMRTGVRYLTYSQFCHLDRWGADGLRRYLKEIRRYSPLKNREKNPEISFFKADPLIFSYHNFTGYDFDGLSDQELFQSYNLLKDDFFKALVSQEGIKPGNPKKPMFAEDKLSDTQWLSSMLAVLVNLEQFTTEEVSLGLCEEFAMNIDWLPGGTIDRDGGLIIDPVYSNTEAMSEEEQKRFSDAIPRHLIKSLVREDFSVEYLNIGRLKHIAEFRPGVSGDDSQQRRGRRAVYILQFKRKGEEHSRTSIMRLQKWGVQEHLNAGCDMGISMRKSEEYSEYVLNRRLACKLLKMNVPNLLSVRSILEIYNGPNGERTPIYTPYFTREYVAGIATHVLKKQYFESPNFYVPFARLLGAAAAANLVVGRSRTETLDVIFDEGDEVLVMDDKNIPTEIIVSEQPGTFVCYKEPLTFQIDQYAKPVLKRLPMLPDPKMFANLYVKAFEERFVNIQRTAEKYRNIFDDLPNHDTESIHGRWRLVLNRLKQANVDELGEALTAAIGLEKQSN